MKVLILANNDSGLYRFRRELLDELVKENEVYFCVPMGKYVESIQKIGCSYIPCTMLNRRSVNPFNEIKLLRYYRKILKEVRPDIVFTYTIKPNVYGGMACASQKIPYVVNITGLGTAVENSGPLQLITVLLYRLGLRKAQKVFFQNAENRDFMLGRGMINSPYELIPGSGVNLNDYIQMPYPQSETIDFVFVARLMKEKGIEQYFDAAKAIKAKHSNAVFHICGYDDGIYQERLDDLQKKGIIVYHGLVRDMKTIYESTACTVHPTFYPEGISNVLLESSASGRPIIATDRSGCKEVIDDGVNGYIIRQRDSQDLIEKIEKFLSLDWEHRKNMGLAGRRKVEKEFDRRVVVEKYLNELHRVKDEKR